MAIREELEAFLQKFASGESQSGSSKLCDLADRSILIYGAGNVGQRLQKALSANNLNVSGFVDKNSALQTLPLAVPVFHPEDEALTAFKKKACVLIAGLFNARTRRSIGDYLSALGFLHFHHLHEVDIARYLRFHCYENSLGSNCRRLDILGREKSKIFQAFDLLHGARDKQCYYHFLKAHLSMDFLQMPAPDDMALQYLAHDIQFSKNYTNFIDCGGYDGDTVQNILQHGHSIHDLILFEPHGPLFKKAADFLRKERRRFQTAIALPCAVFSETGSLPFNEVDSGASTGRLDASADHFIQCVKLDDVLPKFEPTFIKMDIEGAELNALQGARKLISRHTPQLAVCVYHRLSHLWDIPLFLHKCSAQYDFYLRCYNDMTMETVLYAFPKA